jgi:hypothetical protein
VSAIPFLGINLKEYKPGNNKDTFHTHVYFSTIHNSQAMEIAQMPSNDDWIKKACIYTQWSIIQP